MARPREYDREALMAELEQYIENTDIPILAEFAAQHGFGKGLLHDWPEFSDLVKRCTSKKESALERQALAGNVNCAMAIFSLKQLGWSDRQDMTLKGDKAHPVALLPMDAAL